MVNGRRTSPLGALNALGPRALPGLTVQLRYDKFILMAAKAKIAFSVDSRLLARVERIRAVTGESRSAVIGRAIARLTSDNVHDEQVRRYSEAYREQPETPTEVEAARRHTRRTLARLPWKSA
jgi:hypothetical protein